MQYEYRVEWVAYCSQPNMSPGERMVSISDPGRGQNPRDIPQCFVLIEKAIPFQSRIRTRK